MISDANERTVRLPVQWIDGQWQLIGGGKLPQLSPNACAEIALPAMYLVDDQQRQLWTKEMRVELLPVGATLFAQLDINKVPFPDREKGAAKRHDTGTASLFFEITLLEELSLSMSLGKKGTLVGGKCDIPSLGVQADSINEAYSKLVRAFNPSRKSFSGNVFTKVFVESDGRMLKLDILRERAANTAAMRAGRPQDRCETWSELATTLSQVGEVWNTADKNETPFPAALHAITPPPQATTDLIRACSDYYDYRCKLLSCRDDGLYAILAEFHNPEVTSNEITHLRKLRSEMDRVVLEAYGWHDLAQAAFYEFLPNNDNDNRFEEGLRSGTQASEPALCRITSYLFRWPNELRNKVLARLLELDKRLRQEKLLLAKELAQSEKFGNSSMGSC